MPPLSKASPRRSCVLAIGADRVEWFEPGPDPVYLSAPLETGSPARMGRAAAKLLRENGIKKRTCRLMLASGLLEYHILRIGAVPPKEVRGVLHRKAANALGEPLEDTVFAAIPMTRDFNGESPAAAAEWMLAVARRKDLLSLYLELRRLGIHVKSVVAGRIAKIAAAAEQVRTEKGAAICVGVSRANLSVSLITDGELVQTVSLAGNYQAGTIDSATILQELRSFEAFWRRRSRGEALGKVILVGFHPLDAMRLTSVVQSSLKSSQTIFFPEGLKAKSGNTAPLERLSALSAALADGPLQMDLRMSLPPRVPRIVCTGLLAVAMGTGIAWNHRENTMEELSGARELLADLRQKTALAREVEQASEAVERVLDALDEEQRAQWSARSLGIDPVHDLPAVLGALDGVAALKSLHIDTREEPGGVELRAVTRPDPGTFLKVSRALRERLGALRQLGEPTLIPPSSMRSTGRSKQGELEFSLEADWEGGR